MSRQPHPFLWIPTLYLAEGIPYFIVNNISVLLFSQMGVSNGEMALFTSFLYLPWVLKPLWSPLVDLFGTKRRWIILTQIIIAALLILLTLSLPHPDTNIIASGKAPVSLFTVTLILFILTSFISATHDISADGFYMLALNGKQQAQYVGIRSLFFRLSNIFCNSLLVFIAGWLQKNGTSIPASWRMTLACAAVLFTLLTLWHSRFLPFAERDKSGDPGESGHSGISGQLHEFGRTFLTFFTKPHIIIALLFMLLFRLPEAFLLKLVPPFFTGECATGALGISLVSYSFIYGIIGVCALLLGGIIGGLFASWLGLRRSMWWMALAITLPNVVYLWLSLHPTQNIALISLAVGTEQFGYGFGFTAYMLYLMYFSQGEHQTSHYALCTGFMALGMMLPGLVAGYLQEWVGYPVFFGIVMVFCLITWLVTEMVRRTVDSQYGRK